MAHIQYSIGAAPRQSSAERLLYISNAAYSGDWDSIPHSHSFTEIFYVTDGAGSFFIGSEDPEGFPIEKDSLILIDPNVRHTEKSSARQPLAYIALGIDNMQFHFPESENASFCHVSLRDRQEPVLPLLKMMLKEAGAQYPSSETICQHYLDSLLLLILRVTGNELLPYSDKNIPAECQFIKDYLDSHCGENISLDRLAELSHLNKYYLSHIFSKAYGIAPINYLLERRILNSQELLKNTDHSIAQIAQITGFSSSNYFSQSFKKYAGSTAASYRKHFRISE